MPTDDTNIAGKIVVITGASSGLGEATDVTDAAQVTRLVDAAVERYGRIDVILNNAGAIPHSPLERLKVEDWDRTIDVNVKGVLYGIAAAGCRLRDQSAGGRGHQRDPLPSDAAGL